MDTNDVDMNDTPPPTELYNQLNSKLCDLAQDYLVAYDTLSDLRKRLEAATKKEMLRRRKLYDMCKTARHTQGVVFKTRVILIPKDEGEPTVVWVLVLNELGWIWNGRD